MVIRTPDQRLRVFVSSSLAELAEERRAVTRAISALRLTPVLFEQGARPHPPRDLYRAYLAQSDVFIGLYWQRYGHIAAGMDVSGLEDEFDLSRGLPRLLYVKAPAPDREPRLTALLARIEREVSYRPFGTPAELDRLVRDDLAMLLSERFAAALPFGAGPVPAPSPSAARSPSAAGRGPRPLPAGTTSLVGREQAIGEVAALVEQAGVRLVTLTGPGGIGKTRLAVAVGQRLRDGFGAGTAYVPLAAVTEPEAVLAGIGRATGADLAGAGSPLEALAERFGDDRWLLILDNLEQVVDVAPDLGELLARCPGMAILATSRTVLGLRAEREYPVSPLELPADSATIPADLAESPAVALFVDRARAVRPGFALTDRNAAAVAQICRRLEGLPLAIELAAARTRLLDPATLLDRLAASFDAVGTGTPDLPDRQQTLRATVEWSVGLLDDAERSLLEILAVFAGGWTIEAAARVAGLDDDRSLELAEALVRHSLVQLDSGRDGPRCRMLETIRQFVAERLAARPDVAEVERRHADYYRALAEQADRPMRGAAHTEWLERLEAETGNLAAAVRWYLAHDPAPLPHLFRVLWPFWFLRDPMGEGRSWVGQLLPAADSLDPQARAELQWTALVAALEVGDDDAALAARERLGPLLAGIGDPYLHAVSQLAMAWSSPILGDLDGALRMASVSLDRLRSLDEPFWTALAVGSLGAVETAVGHYDDALLHLGEAGDLGDRFGSAWLGAWSRVQIGTLFILRGHQDEARARLDEALNLSLSAHSTRSVTLCLAAFARLALAQGDPERAALLAGAAEGLRRPAGLRPWPTLRRAEAEMVVQARQALGAGRFDQVFASGSRLSRPDAVAAARGLGR
jgi:predicted ATPase